MAKKTPAPTDVRSTKRNMKRGKALTAARSAPHIGVSPGHKAEFAAASLGCLDKGAATLLVFSCTGIGAVDPQTTLDVLSAGDAIRRQGFCGCVFNKAAAAGATVTLTAIPCAATNTVEDVIDSISC